MSNCRGLRQSFHETYSLCGFLGALYFPGALTSAGPDHMFAAIIGCSLAILLAWFGTNLILVVAGGITGSLLVNLFF